MSLNERHPFWFNSVAFCDARLYDISGINFKYVSMIAGQMNTTIMPLQIELGGRVNLGEGALDFKVYETAKLYLINFEKFQETHKQRLESAFSEISGRPVRSVFEELGFELCRGRKCAHPEHPYEHVRPEALTLEQVQAASPDRFELDRVVFDVLGLTDDERREVYRAVAQLVKDRLVKARSV